MSDCKNKRCPSRYLGGSHESLHWALKSYRRDFLRPKKNKQGYTSKLKKGSPKEIQNVIARLDRKINNMPIFSKAVKKTYLEGICAIYSKYYDLLSVHQGYSRQDKKAINAADEWYINYQKKQSDKYNLKIAKERQETFAIQK